MAQKLPNENPDPTYPRPPSPPRPPSKRVSHLYWIYEVPPDREEYLLLNSEREISAGIWYGNIGNPYVAYCQLPIRDKAIEKRLISVGKIKR